MLLSVLLCVQMVATMFYERGKLDRFRYKTSISTVKMEGRRPLLFLTRGASKFYSLITVEYPKNFQSISEINFTFAPQPGKFSR